MQLKKLIYLVLFLGILLMTSCEKETNSILLKGKWTFLEACNLNLTIACIKAENRDFRETIEFTDTKYSINFEDSIVSIVTYTTDNEWIVFGDSIKVAKRFILRNDTLTIIDTCFSCYSTNYIRTND